MMNTIEIDGYRAVIAYDPDTEMFLGEFVGFNGSADFYAKDAESLKKEGAISLKVFLDMCAEDGINPRKKTLGVKSQKDIFYEKVSLLIATTHALTIVPSISTVSP